MELVMASQETYTLPNHVNLVKRQSFYDIQLMRNIGPCK